MNTKVEEEEEPNGEIKSVEEINPKQDKDGEVMDIGMDNMEKTGNEVVEMTQKQDEGDEIK